ncbi:KpsF/GutQ family sugar-phosphate isomerase [Sphingomonas oleivorans]|uniref:KpsF/GutQ family sugar-phosphate isomerase n=1 Tax=Sphingomonas oleivorans TaxID=1735121 RepID=UPI001FAF088E|nr:KpsF/GutQ family sugar-phosphate isomerase [Sphingomonas oleivorans]
MVPLVRKAPLEADSTLDYARSVIRAEASALSQLAMAVDENFVDAVDRILAIRGRVVVTGMGKSGHVGRKIAATLAATGTPAIFVHPAEAAHGDLGMLVRGDLLLVLSNSGRTAELQAIVAHAQRLRVEIVAIASRGDSALMRQADVQLLLPAVREACPANIAPTTSTVLMMALGDALAIAAMRVRGYSSAGLKILHPGGQIGARLRAVATLMHMGESMPLVSSGDPMREVIVTMTGKSFGIAGVVDDGGRLVGVITDGDLRRHADSLMEGVAADVMTQHPVTIDASATAEEAVALMKEHRITSLFVGTQESHGRPVGIVHVHDFLRLGIA